MFAIPALWLTCNGVAMDTDSALRLVQVRDLLHGQAWFDTVQHRLNTPYGLPMHWSRLVDSPLALLMLAGEGLAVRVWPLALFFAALFLVTRIARALAGPDSKNAAVIAVLGLTLLCTEIYPPFSPGDIDHHGLQLVLTLAALLSLVEQRPVLTAISVALGLGVGLESLPYACVASLAAALWLKRDPGRARLFGATLAATALLLDMLVVAHSEPRAACDSFSSFYATLLTAGGAGLMLVARLPRRRLMALAALAPLLLAVAAWINPGCFAGPYGGLDAPMQAIFLSRINEARPIWSFWQLAPAQVIGGYLYAIFAVIMGFVATPSRARTLTLALAGTALVVATLQYRAVSFAIVFALPLAAAALARLFRARIAVLAAAIIFLSGGSFTLAGALLEGQDRVTLRVTKFHTQEACASPEAMALLDRLPPGRVASFVDQGPAILAYTQDAAIAGPYHRDAAGILDSYAIFTGPNPRSVLQRRGIDYVMTCRAAPDWDYYRAQGPQGLIAQLAQNNVPDWLAPAASNGDVTVYRVR